MKEIFWINPQLYLRHNKDRTRLIGFKISKNKKTYRLKREVLARTLGLPKGAIPTKIKVFRGEKLIDEL